MKKVLLSCLCALMTLSSSTRLSAIENDISEFPEDTDALYRVGDGAYDGSYTSLSKSLLGWGVGLGLGIGILCALLHQSKSSTAHD
ncbi:MAG: hypothetical protein V4494_06910 [Chlamydiota bacterium]